MKPVAEPCVTVTGDICTAVFQNEHFHLYAKPAGHNGPVSVTCVADDLHRAILGDGWAFTGRTNTPGQQVWTYERKSKN